MRAMTDQCIRDLHASVTSQPSTLRKPTNESKDGKKVQNSTSCSESSEESRGRPSKRGDRVSRDRSRRKDRSSPHRLKGVRDATGDSKQISLSIPKTLNHSSNCLSVLYPSDRAASPVSTPKPAIPGLSSPTEVKASGYETTYRPPSFRTRYTAITEKTDGSSHTSINLAEPALARNPSAPNRKVKDLQVLQEVPTVTARPKQDVKLAARLPLLRITCPDKLVVASPRAECTRSSTRLIIRGGTRHPRPSEPVELLSPKTPRSRGGSDVDSDAEGYQTPLTSPEASPLKEGHVQRRLLRQLDGAESTTDDPFEDLSISAGSTVATSDRRARLFSKSENSHHRGSSDSANSCEKPPSYYAEQGNDVDDEYTPLVTPSPAKSATAFPFPKSTLITPSRYPSSLLQHCERNATPRQRRVMTMGISSPDRFIPRRCATPSKEAFLLTDARKSKQSEFVADPFSPTIRRSVRMAEQHATIRTPAPAMRPVGNAMTRVRDAREPATRSSTQAGVWSVGGIPVTEGIPSTSNGRGGRITSGTSAPHYAAEFHRRRSQTDEQVTHGRRLAFAMDVNQNGRMLHQSTVSLSPTSGNREGPKRVLWNDGKWESPITQSPTKAKSKRPKDIPVIPYRVLDAPALRDDYYCSLLAHSQTLQCLAVGLGPHVYLWIEDRGKTGTSLPDSLTVPRGTSHVTSLSFSSTGGGNAILAIGRGDGRITLWSPLDRDPRFDSEQPSPVSHVSFRPTTHRRRSIRDSNISVDTEELLVGDEVGNVYLYSIEWPNQTQRDLFDWHGSMTLLARISCHSQQICGIAWSPDGELFATGGNDNNLYLFETKKILRRPRSPQNTTASAVHVRNGNAHPPLPGQGDVLTILPGQQKHIFTLNAACKALAFAPWQPSLLVAGGGSNDRCIHFFHALSGATLSTIDCYAQVTSLVFNPRKRELAATFGFAQPEHPYRIAVFSWPSCRMVVGIPWWGEERALYSVGYPGQGGSLVVATSDASIKFHEVWSSGGEGKEGGEGRVLGSQILDDVLAVEREEIIR